MLIGIYFNIIIISKNIEKLDFFKYIIDYDYLITYLLIYKAFI